MRRVLAAVTLAGALMAPLVAQADPGDAAAGARSFAICASCHARTAAEPARTGPALAGVYGKKAASGDAKFVYSPALKGAKLTWNDKTLDAWLSRPAALAPGNKMAFAGVANAQTRANIIAYLKTLGR